MLSAFHAPSVLFYFKFQNCMILKTFVVFFITFRPLCFFAMTTAIRIIMALIRLKHRGLCVAISNRLPVEHTVFMLSAVKQHKPAQYYRYSAVFSRRGGQRDRMRDRLQGCRKAIMVNRITVTAFGWIQLFKTRLRMGNFLSGSILGTPTFGSSQAQGPLSQREGAESFFCCFFFCPF